MGKVVTCTVYRDARLKTHKEAQPWGLLSGKPQAVRAHVKDPFVDAGLC